MIVGTEKRYQAVIFETTDGDSRSFELLALTPLGFMINVIQDDDDSERTPAASQPCPCCLRASIQSSPHH